MILYEGPLALSPSHLEMFTLSRVHVRVQRRLDSCHVKISTNEIALFSHRVCEDFWLSDLRWTQKHSENMCYGRYYNYLIISRRLLTLA